MSATSRKSTRNEARKTLALRESANVVNELSLLAGRSITLFRVHLLPLAMRVTNKKGRVSQSAPLPGNLQLLI
jgi:hypothetical protein